VFVKEAPKSSFEAGIKRIGPKIQGAENPVAPPQSTDLGQPTIGPVIEFLKNLENSLQNLSDDTETNQKLMSKWREQSSTMPEAQLLQATTLCITQKSAEHALGHSGVDAELMFSVCMGAAQRRNLTLDFLRQIIRKPVEGPLVDTGLALNLDYFKQIDELPLDASFETTEKVLSRAFVPFSPEELFADPKVMLNIVRGLAKRPDAKGVEKLNSFLNGTRISEHVKTTQKRCSPLPTFSSW